MRADEAKVSAAKSTFDFSEGPFPKQIMVNGVKILADSISLLFDNKRAVFYFFS